MVTRVVRKIVNIDEEKCNGCGICVPACAEGAIDIIDGKARLISDKYCDGLGACLGECPQDAITVVERESEEFDENAVELHQQSKELGLSTLPCGCPSSAVDQWEKRSGAETAISAEDSTSMLAHWPVQLALVPPSAPFLQGADVMLTADCVPFAYAGFHMRFLRGRTVLVACPKLDDFQAHLTKLTKMLQQAQIRSLTVVRMEVPCCSGLVHMAQQALRLSGKEIPFNEVIIGTRGDLTQ